MPVFLVSPDLNMVKETDPTSRNRRRRSVILGLSKSRRKSAIPGLKCPEEMSAEEVEKLYKKPDPGELELPEPKELETVFEAEAVAQKRGVTEELMLGKNKSRRVLEPPKFWLEDAAKTKHRQKMSNKAFKGKKKLKLVPLAEADENALIELIQNKEDTLEEEQIEADLKTPNTTPKEFKTPLLPFQAETPRSIRGSKRRKSKALASLVGGKTPIRRTSLILTPEVEPSSEEAISKEELIRQIEEADSFFGNAFILPPPPRTHDPENQENENSSSELVSATATSEAETGARSRKSVSVKVRRSSRHIRNCDDVGTVFQVTELEVKSKKAGRRSAGLIPPPPSLGFKGLYDPQQHEAAEDIVMETTSAWSNNLVCQETES